MQLNVFLILQDPYTWKDLKFDELAEGNVRGYCCSNNIVLDFDLLQLLDEESNILDQYRDILAAHATRILQTVEQRSQREVEQFCFGWVQSEKKQDFGRIDLRNSNSWSKDGLNNIFRYQIKFNLFSTLNYRKLKKSCCSLCCSDVSCHGCKSCLCK